MKVDWIRVQTDEIYTRDYVCGYCSKDISSAKFYKGEEFGKIYICHKCGKPTFFDNYGNQTPGPIPGNSVKHVTDEKIVQLYEEIRKCFSINAFTSCVIGGRKLLMNIAVNKGANERENFQFYVNYLSDQSYIPPNGKTWVDSIRKLGNEANHEIDFKTDKDAKMIISFCEMLLRFIYEMPGILNENTEKSES